MRLATAVAACGCPDAAEGLDPDNGAALAAAGAKVETELAKSTAGGDEFGVGTATELVLGVAMEAPAGFTAAGRDGSAVGAGPEIGIVATTLG